VPERDGVDLIIEQWQRARPDLDSSPIGIVGRLSRLAREIEDRLEPVYREHGLEPGWHDLLATRPTDLTNASMLTSSGTTKRLDKLEAAGLIARSADPDDRRGTLISLTAAGRRLIDELTPAHLDNERRILAALSEADQRRLADLLRKLQLGLPEG
jgi:DNA-binding MarR family transcriptional regulator